MDLYIDSREAFDSYTPSQEDWDEYCEWLDEEERESDYLLCQQELEDFEGGREFYGCGESCF